MATGAGRRYRIGIGGIAIESCTFSPLLSTLDDFTIRRGDAMQEMYPYLPGWRYRDRAEVTFVPCLKAEALSGGEVDPEAYGAMKGELLERLRTALPLDGFFLDIHGAMSVIGLEDAEADLAAAIREVVGLDCVISAGMDLHGNVTERLVSLVDVFTCYREAPHIDAMATKERAIGHLVHCLDTGTRPHRAWVRIPVMLPGERTSTFVEPGKTVYGKLTESDGVPGVIDSSLWVGFVWADQPRTGATVVVSGTDAAAISRESEKIARRYWDARREFGFEAPTGEPDWAIDEALKLNQKAVFVSDSGDNPTAGAAGDTPFMVERLLARPELASGARTAVLAAIPDARAVAACFEAGVGAAVCLEIGGKLDPVHGRPLPISGVVHALQRDDPVGGDSAVVRVGGVYVALTTRRKVFFARSDFEAVDLNVERHDVIVVKIGYLFPEQRAMAAAAFMALSPGAVSLDIPSLPYARVPRPVFPLDPEMPNPDFTPTVFGPIGA